MKKIISTILILIAAIAMILMCGENPDGSVNLFWSGGCLIVFVIAAKIWEKLNPEESNNDASKRLNDR